MAIINTRVPVQQVKAGDLIVATHILPTEPPRSYGVVAEVKDVSRYGDEYTVYYGACDDPSSMCYGSDVTLRRGQKITRLVIA